MGKEKRKGEEGNSKLYCLAISLDNLTLRWLTKCSED